MVRRIALAGAALVAVAGVLVWLWLPHRDAAEAAARVAGERWYVVAFRHTPIGQYRTASGVTAGGYEFRTALRFSLDGAIETRDETRLVFARWPPHGLRVVEKRVQVGDATTEMAYRDGAATVFEEGRQRRMAAELDYRLADHLAIERWLASPAAMPGDRRTGRSLVLDRLAVAPVSWQLLERRGERVAVAGAWPPAARFEAAAEMSSRLTLDGRGAPLRMEVGDTLTLQRVPDATAAAVWRRSAPVFSAAAPGVAADRPLAAPAKLKALTVAVEGPGTGPSAWPAMLAADIDAPRALSEADLAAARLPTVRYPADDAQLGRLARRAVAGLAAPADQVPALVRFVHGHLRYQDTSAVRTVLDTARDRAGDCTEYADLFTTLARSLGLPAQTVVGLAYRADSQAFVLHAWNEVAVDGRWQPVDPTWNQAPSDATHLALPSEAALAAIAELPKLRFRVLQTRY